MALGLIVAACNDAKSSFVPTGPTTPTAPPTAAAPPPAAQLPVVLRGYVSDTAYRAIANASIEVTQGPDAGTVMFSDALGAFSYTGMFATPVTLRASKDGYTVGITTARLLSTGSAWAYFQLTSIVAPVAVLGTYTLTITADPSCTGLPEDVRTRSYPAVVAANSAGTGPPDTSFNGTVTGALFAPYASVFRVGVSGHDVAVTTEGEGPTIVEQVSPNRYVAFMATARAVVDGAEVSTMTSAFRGLLEYCELKSPLTTYYDCRPDLALVQEQCTSDNHTLTLTRR
jgi:hypothetical protein